MYKHYCFGFGRSAETAALYFDVTVTFIGLCVSVPTSPLEPEHKEDPIYNEDVDNEVSFLEVKDLIAWSQSLPDDI